LAYLLGFWVALVTWVEKVEKVEGEVEEVKVEMEMEDGGAVQEATGHPGVVAWVVEVKEVVEMDLVAVDCMAWHGAG
jgi:hypothetical protein